jgi:hypothetical protein
LAPHFPVISIFFPVWMTFSPPPPPPPVMQTTYSPLLLLPSAMRKQWHLLCVTLLLSLRAAWRKNTKWTMRQQSHAKCFFTETHMPYFFIVTETSTGKSAKMLPENQSRQYLLWPWQLQTRQAMYEQHDNEARSRNNCYRGKAISIIYSECMFAALIFQHAKSMRLLT